MYIYIYIGLINPLQQQLDEMTRQRPGTGRRTEHSYYLLVVVVVVVVVVVCRGVGKRTHSHNFTPLPPSFSGSLLKSLGNVVAHADAQSTDDSSLIGTVLAYQGRYQEAAKAWVKANKVRISYFGA